MTTHKITITFDVDEDHADHADHTAPWASYVRNTLEVNGADDIKIKVFPLAEAVFEKAKALLPETVDLVYVDYDDKFFDEQIREMLTGKPIGEIASLDNWEFEARGYGEDAVIDNLGLTCTELSVLRGSDFYDDLRQELWDRDERSWYETMMSHTPNKWFRYRVGEEMAVYDQGDWDEVVEAVADLGIDTTTDENVAAINEMLGNAGQVGVLYVLWQGSVDAMVEAASDGRAHEITWTDPTILFMNPFAGSGWSGDFTGTITRTFDCSDLILDEGDGSWSTWVCGGLIGDEDTATITTVQTAREISR